MTTKVTASVEKFTTSKPFDKDSGGDSILRTSDEVDFYVHQTVLRLASSVFADMFSMPQGSKPAETPVITVAEDSRTLNTLLRSVYPVRRPTVRTLDLAYKLVEASEKYFISTRLLPLQTLLTTPIILERDPLKAYALAFRLRYKEAALKASDYTHRVDLGPRPVKAQLARDSGGHEALASLYELRLRREHIMRNIVALVPLKDLLCTGCRSNGYQPMKILQEKVVKAIRAALDVPNFKPSSPEAFFKLGPIASVGCSSCQRIPFGEKLTTANWLPGLAERLMTEFELLPRTIAWSIEQRAGSSDDENE